MKARLTLTLIGVLAGLVPALTIPRASEADTPGIRFDAAISGKIHTSGSVNSAAAVLQQQPPEFNGCAIIKHKHTILGLYTLEVRVNRASFLLGGWQHGALDLSIDNYQPNVSTYKSPNIGGKFAFRGQAFGASVINSSVRVLDGGRSGIYTDQHAYHIDPGTANAFITTGTLTFRASWHCAGVFHFNES